MSRSGHYVDHFFNSTPHPAFCAPGAQIAAGGRVVRSTLLGPLALGERSQLGPDVIVGRYSGINADSFIARATVGAFCSFGSRVSINPLNHPLHWLSIHEFQYHETAYGWDEGYRSVHKLPHPAPETTPRVVIGNDVWIGHNAVVLEGLVIGDGAVIGTGAVVTKDIPPYAIAVGNPARVKNFRFPEGTIARLLATRWWELELAQLKSVSFDRIELALDQIEAIRAGSASFERKAE